ncbi:hypothetical protein B296_00015912, partial [Ensete ventricosum]
AMAVSSETAARSLVVVFLLAVLAATGDARQANNGGGVTYDGRSLIINGKRELLFSGSVHYPRSTPEVANPPRFHSASWCMTFDVLYDLLLVIR